MTVVTTTSSEYLIFLILSTSTVRQQTILLVFSATSIRIDRFICSIPNFFDICIHTAGLLQSLTLAITYLVKIYLFAYLVLYKVIKIRYIFVSTQHVSLTRSQDRGLPTGYTCNLHSKRFVCKTCYPISITVVLLFNL